MGSRENAAKMLKMKRRGRKKTYGKQFINTGSSPNVEVMSGYSRRGRSVADPWLERLFPGSNMSKNKRLHYLSKIEGMIKETPQELFVTLQKSTHIVSRMFFNSQMTCCYVIEENTLAGYVRGSITYDSSERCKKAFRLNTIRWKESFLLGDIPD